MRFRSFAIPALLAASLLFAAGCGSTPEAAAPATAPAAPAAPAAAVAPAAPSYDGLIISYDTVRGTKNVPDELKADKGCVVNTRFLRNEQLVWRIKVVDPKTGELLGKDDLSTLEVVLADGTVVKPSWGARPKAEPTDEFWAGGWVIPSDYPTGQLKLTINAVSTDGRKTGTVTNFNISNNYLMILDGEVPIL